MLQDPPKVETEVTLEYTTFEPVPRPKSTYETLIEEMQEKKFRPSKKDKDIETKTIGVSFAMGLDVPSFLKMFSFQSVNQEVIEETIEQAFDNISAGTPIQDYSSSPSSSSISSDEDQDEQRDNHDVPEDSHNDVSSSIEDGNEPVSESDDNEADDESEREWQAS